MFLICIPDKDDLCILILQNINMNEYIPRCKIYDEVFEFSAKIEEDIWGWEVVVSITENTRCKDCFLREECLASVNALIDEAFELEEQKTEWSDRNYN
jgi:hypothetical protein